MRSTLYLLLGAVGAPVPHRLRERRESAPRARERADARDGAACGARCRSLAHLRQLIVESLLLGAIWVARSDSSLPYTGTGLLVRVAPADLPRLDEVRLT